MRDYSAKDVKNVVVLGHSGAGKSTLIESCLFTNKQIDKFGRNNDGTSALNYDPEEGKRGLSVYCHLAPVEWKNKKINFIDTPGYMDYEGEESAGIAVGDTALIVVNGKELISFFKGDSSIVSKSEDVGTYTYVLRQILRSIISPAINNAAITALFYKYLDEKNEHHTLSEDIFKVKHYTKRRTILVLAALGVMSFGILVLMTYNYSYLMEDVDRPLVCAHRGDNANAPENTMPAFELAASENLKWIELDVHQTSDGVIVCNHDQTLKRVTGQNVAIHDHTYEELSEYELGEWMPGDYDDVYIATLEEALLLAKENDMNVQVELKGHPDDVNFEENVLEIINKTGMHDNVMIIAQDASRLQRVAELDPEITKGYCMFIAMGDLYDIEYTDNITIEETYVTPELVRDMHEQGILVFCWTVDRDDTVQYLVSCDVDVIGTDDPILISDALDKADYTGGFSRAFHIVMHMIATMDK